MMNNLKSILYYWSENYSFHMSIYLQIDIPMFRQIGKLMIRCNEQLFQVVLEPDLNADLLI